MVNTSNLPHTTLTAHNGARTDTGGKKNVLFVCIKKNLSAHSMVRIPRTGMGKKKEKETPVSISTLYGEDTTDRQEKKRKGNTCQHTLW
jgi:hypothetical protein